MERKIFQKYTVCIVTIMLFVFTLSVAKSVFVRGIEKLNFPSPTTNIDWAKLYPFKDQAQDSKTDNTRLGTYYKTIEYLKGRVADYSKKVFCYENFIELAIMAENFLAMPNMSDYRILNGNYLVYNSSAKIDVTPYAESLKNFNHFLQNRSIALLYVQLPSKVCKEDEALLPHNRVNENADNLLLALKQAEVPYLDMRQEIHKQGLVHHDLFFKTDHHWKPETGLWASGIIAEYLNSHFDFDIDISLYNPERYDYQVYDDFLGSIGIHATLAVAKQEPIFFMFPKFDTDLTVRIPSRSVEQRGDFHVMYHQEYLEYVLQVNMYRKDYYGVYCYGGNPVMFIRNNHLQHNRKKILMIRDSFSCVVTPFLALGITDVEAMELRKGFDNFSGSVQSFIEESLPDVVLILYYPDAINNYEEAFDFR